MNTQPIDTDAAFAQLKATFPGKKCSVTHRLFFYGDPLGEEETLEFSVATSRPGAGDDWHVSKGTVPAAAIANLQAEVLRHDPVEKARRVVEAAGYTLTKA